MIVTHYLRRDYTAEYVHHGLAVGKHYLVLYEPSEFDECWRLVEFKLIQQWHVRRAQMDRLVVKVAEWDFDEDPRVERGEKIYA
jgi:hypothetical protein